MIKFAGEAVLADDVIMALKFCIIWGGRARPTHSRILRLRTYPHAEMLPGMSVCLELSIHIREAGIAVFHSRGDTIPILQGLEIGWRGYTHTHTQEEVVRKKNTVF